MRTICLSALLFLLPLVALADLEIEMSVTQVQAVGGKATSKEYVTRTWFKKDMMTTWAIDGAQRIIRFDKQVIWDIPKGGKSYTEATFAEIQQKQRKSRHKQAQRIEQIKNLLVSPGVPEKTKIRLRELIKPKVYKVKTTGSEKVLTFSCTRHKITRNGDDYMEIWACEKLDAGVEFNRIQSLSASPQKGLQQELDKIKGVWIKWSLTRKASGYSVKQTAVATKVLTEELDPRSFNLPEGAKKTG